MLQLTECGDIGIVITVILLQLHVALSMKDAVSPDDPVVFIGDNLTLTCELDNTGQNIHGLSSLMYFTQRSHTPIGRQYVKVISMTTIQLNYPITSTDDETNYKCWLNQPGQDSKLLGHSFVQVEYRPVPVRDVSCRVYNWESMVCSWTLDNVFVQNKHFSTALVWRIGLHNNGTQHHCPHQTLTSCTWYRHADNDVFVPGSVYKIQVILLYNMTTSFSSKTAEAVSEEFLIHSSIIVQPAPPASLAINTTSTCVYLKWNDSTPHRKNKVFQIQFQSEWDRDSVWRHCCDTARDSRMSKYSARVCDLVPRTSYTFRVSSRPVQPDHSKHSGFWSDWITVHITTAGGVPVRAPEVARGGYNEDKCSSSDDCRNVTIYFKALLEQNKGGKFVSYRLRINGGAKTSSVVSNFTVVTITMSQNTDYKIDLYSRNEFGESAEFSTLVIPSVDKKPPVPDTFLVEAEPLRSPSASTKYRLSWTVESSKTPAAGYTVYWCHLTLGRAQCKNINWTTVDGAQSNLQLVFEHPLHQVTSSRYQFGISTEMMIKGKVISSGILWSDCVYTYYKIAKLPDPPENFDISSFQEGGSLAVTWDKPSCRGSRVYITYYVIRFCETEAHKICADGTTNVTVPNSATRYVISGLKGDATYQVTIQAASRAGLGPTSIAVVGKVKWPGLRTGTVVAIAVGCIIAAVLILLGILYVVRKFQHAKKKFRLQASYPSRHLELADHNNQNYTMIPIQDSGIKVDSGRGESNRTDESFPNVCIDKSTKLKPTHTNTSDERNRLYPTHENTSDEHIDSYSKFTAADDTGQKPESSPCDENMNDFDEGFKVRNMHPPLPQENSFVVGFVLSPAHGSVDQKETGTAQLSSDNAVDVSGGSVDVSGGSVDISGGSVGERDLHATLPVQTLVGGGSVGERDSHATLPVQTLVGGGSVGERDSHATLPVHTHVGGGSVGRRDLHATLPVQTHVGGGSVGRRDPHATLPVQTHVGGGSVGRRDPHATLPVHTHVGHAEYV